MMKRGQSFSSANLEGFDDLRLLLEDIDTMDIIKIAPSCTNDHDQIITASCGDSELGNISLTDINNNNNIYSNNVSSQLQFATSIEASGGDHQNAFCNESNISDTMFDSRATDSNIFAEQQNSIMAIDSGINDDQSSIKNSVFNSKRIVEKKLKTKYLDSEEIDAKKHNHNARERDRRMKLHRSYVALGSLLPPKLQISKNKWNAPTIIDKVLNYIPEIVKEMQDLTLKKDTLQTLLVENRRLNIGSEATHLSVSTNQVNKDELILQICRKRDDNLRVSGDLLKRFEAEGFRVLSFSTLRVCDDRECYNIHIQTHGIKINESPSSRDEADNYYIEGLKNKVISWLS